MATRNTSQRWPQNLPPRPSSTTWRESVPAKPRLCLKTKSGHKKAHKAQILGRFSSVFSASLWLIKTKAGRLSVRLFTTRSVLALSLYRHVLLDHFGDRLFARRTNHTLNLF